MFLFWVMNLTNSWLWTETLLCCWHPTYLPLTKYVNGPPWHRLPFNDQQQFSHSHNCLSSAPCPCQFLVYLTLRESGANALLSVKISEEESLYVILTEMNSGFLKQRDSQAMFLISAGKSFKTWLRHFPGRCIDWKSVSSICQKEKYSIWVKTLITAVLLNASANQVALTLLGPEAHLNQYINDSKWIFVADVKKFPPSVNEISHWQERGIREVTETLTFHHQNLISSSFSPSRHLCQFWRNSLKNCFHENCIQT